MNESTTQQPSTSPPPSDGRGDWPAGLPLDPPAAGADRDAWLEAVQAFLRPPLPEVTPPCPWWCQHVELHPFDLGMSTWSSLMRFHEADCAAPAAAPYAVAVVQTETTALDGLSRVELEAPIVTVYGDLENVTAEQARAVGVALIKAADLLDRVNAEAKA